MARSCPNDRLMRNKVITHFNLIDRRHREASGLDLVEMVYVTVITSKAHSVGFPMSISGIETH